MIKNISVIFVILLSFSYGTNSQNFSLKLKENKYPVTQNREFNLSSLTKKADAPPYVLAIYALTLINPMLVIEDKKAFFGLTKEVSFVLSTSVRLGRVSFEYSYVFRNYNRNHLRFSYNYDIILESSDFAAFILTPGAGYFTDTKNKGWFLHTSAGVFLAPMENIAIYPYFRLRHTFINDRNKSDINDISLGMAFLFYY